MAPDNIVRHTVRVGSFTLLSRLLGYVRDSINAALFGAGDVSDAFLWAFRIPNLFRDITAEGTFSAAFVPIFSRTLEKEGKSRALETANIIVNALVVFLLVIIAAGILLAPMMVRLMLPGWAANPGKQELTVLLVRLLFPFIGFISLAAVVMGVLNSFKRYSLPALAPCLFNLAMILTGWFVCPLFGDRPEQQIIGWTLGTLLGSALQLAVQLPAAFQEGVVYRFRLLFRHPVLRQMGTLLVPGVLALSITQVNFLVNSFFTSYMPDKSITYQYYGNRLMQLPLALFGISVATVILPMLSRAIARQDLSGARSIFSESIRLVFFFTVPSAVGICVLSLPINTLLFQYGSFLAADAQATALTSIYYSLGLFAYAGTRVTNTVYFGFLDTMTPFKVGLVNVILNIMFNVVLMKPLSYCGPALATSLSGIASFFLLLFLLRRKMGRVDGREIVRSIVRTGIAALLMGLMVWGFDRWLCRTVPDTGRLFRLVEVVAAGSFGIGVYLGISRLMGLKELGEFLGMIRSRTAARQKS